jgi:hypothetical protein
VFIPPPCPSPVAEPAQYFFSPSRRAYRITWSQEPVEEFERRAVFPPDAAPPGPDDYIGTDRGKAKTSIAPGPHETFATVGDLLDDLEANSNDSKMLNYTPPLRRDFDFDRVKEENRNVTVTGWLYAAKKEDNDNDFHLIVGTDPNGGTIRYMNMEITGLPLGGPNRAKLRVPRQAFKDFLGEHHKRIGTSTYLRFEDPIPVRVTGSLFYDIDHKPGVVGSFKSPRRVPATAWEVHPITEIVFEP